MKAYQIETTSGPILVADFEDAQAVAAERDQLKAQVERLQEATYAARIDWGVTPNGKLLSVLHETPTQSLAEHDAALLERVADEWAGLTRDGCIWWPIPSLRGKAARIREEAKS